MIATRARLWSKLLIVLAIVGPPLARGQETRPDATTTPATPEAFLKGQELKRSGSFWVLESESKVLKDLRDARIIYRQVEDATMRRQQLDYGMQDRQGALIQLRGESEVIGQQIAELDQQLEQLVVPPGGNNFVVQQREQVANQRNNLVRHNNQLINQINTIQELSRTPPDMDPRLQLNAEIAEARDRYMSSLSKMRASVNEVNAQYQTLSKNPEVTRALETLSQSSKTKLRLGPSKALLEAIKLLEKSEGNIKFEEVPLHRDGGVFHVYVTLGELKPIKMVFDTGAALTTISSKVAAEAGVKLRSGDSTIQLRTADGTVVKGKSGIIPSMRVGKFTVANVECAIMPAEKGEIDPLLGQSFLKSFKVELEAEAGKLKLTQVETESNTESTSTSTRSTPKAATKNRRPTRQLRPSAKSKQAPRGRGATIPGAESQGGNGTESDPG